VRAGKTGDDEAQITIALTCDGRIAEMGRSADAAARASAGKWHYADPPDGDHRDPQ